MGFDVDRDSIARLVRSRIEAAHMQCDEPWQPASESSEANIAADLWVTLNDADRHVAAREVASVLALRPADAPWTVDERPLEPTEGGVLVRLHFAGTLDIAMSFLLDRLTAAGHSGAIAAPPRAPLPYPLGVMASSEPVPTLLVRFTLKSPTASGPLNVYGLPAPRWGLDAGETQLVASQATQWASEVGSHGEVWFPESSITPIDAPDLITRRIVDDERQRVTFHFTGDLQGNPSQARWVEFAEWGQMSYKHLDLALDPVRSAGDYMSVIQQLAPRLDSAVVVHTTNDSVWSHQVLWWSKATSLWQTHVADAAGIQLINGVQLRRANDLSRWNVEEVAADRYLVSARDLAPWYTEPLDRNPRARRLHGQPPQDLPVPEVLSRARADIGDLRFTKDLLNQA